MEEQRIFASFINVLPFEIRRLKIGHTEQRRTQRFYIAVIVRHRGTVGAWRNRGYLRVLLMFLFTSLQSGGLQDFLKCLLPKLSATRKLRLCCSLCLRHLRDIVFMFSPPCSPPLCVPFLSFPPILPVMGLYKGTNNI